MFPIFFFSMDMHRVMLASVSNYFHTLLIRNVSNELTLYDTSGVQIRIIGFFVYNGLIDQNFDTIELTLKTATRFHINNMVKACKTFLETNLDVHSCVTVYCLSNKYDIADVKDKAFELILQNFERVAKERQFLQLSSNDLQLILNSNMLKVLSEKTVFDALKLWLDNFDAASMNNVVQQLLPFINVALLNEKVINLITRID